MWIIACVEEYQEGSDLTPKLNSSLGKPKAVTQEVYITIDISGEVGRPSDQLLPGLSCLVVLSFHPIYRL